MANSINNFKQQQTSYLRQVQQEKAAKKRDLMAQQQQDLIDLRQYYSEENKHLEQQSSDAISHIRNETDEQLQLFGDERRQQQEQSRLQREEQLEQQRQSQNTVNSSSASIYTRQGRRQALGSKENTVNAKSDPQDDDFYKLQNRGSRVAEKSHHYIIEAFAPAHEKDNIRVSVHRDRAVVSGKRKFADSAEDGNRKISTNNYQSFREEFKFSHPVDTEGMTRERIGDFVRLTIPKLESDAG